MSSVKIHDSEGRLYRDGEPTNEQDEEISNYFTSGIRFALKTGRRYTITVFFRAAESSASRSEQFYASYTARNVGDVDNLVDEVENVVEGQWGYSVESSSEDMAVYRQLESGQYSVPGSDIDRTLLEEVLQQTRSATVGTGSVSDAIGLLFSMESSFGSAAVASSNSGSAFSSFDLVASVGRHSGIEPIGDTEAAWDRARNQVRDKVLNEKVESIREDVRDLSSTWGYDDETIRQEVTRRVPALSSPTPSTTSSTTSSGGSLDSGALGGGGSDDEYKKYIGIGLIVISVLGFIALAALLITGNLGL